jgi:hypothetical protein
MPAPRNLPADLAAHLAELEARLEKLETPQGFSPAFLTRAASLTAASAAAAPGGWAIAQDLKTLVWSDGASWRRADTGAVIV